MQCSRNKRSKESYKIYFYFLIINVFEQKIENFYDKTFRFSVRDSQYSKQQIYNELLLHYNIGSIEYDFSHHLIRLKEMKS